MVDALNARGVYREDVMAVTCEQFHTSTIKLPKTFFSSGGILHTVGLVPAKFACLRFMNDARSLSEEVVRAGENPKEARSKNVTFVDI